VPHAAARRKPLVHRDPRWDYASVNDKQRSLVKDSKFLSLVLRHDPGRVGITLDHAGWTEVAGLLAALRAHGRALGRERLDRVVAENDKKRFEFDAAGTRIRASQGHTVAVDLGYAAASPPAVLFHGTVRAALDSVFREGLLAGRRHHVHLSADQATAIRVGSRRGRPVVLRVDAARMAADGEEFRLSTNGVWLALAVPARYLTRLPDGEEKIPA
jgi:putative RNA 2'-phosphotransferase